MAAFYSKDLMKRFKNLSPRKSTDFVAFNCQGKDLFTLVSVLQSDYGFSHLADLTAIDHGLKSQSRYTMVYHFFQSIHCNYIRIAVDIEDSENPKVDSLTGLYASADWHERETYDLLGIHFVGHPDLRRILMWDDYPHHPLRKDFPLAGIEVPFPATDIQKTTGVKVQVAPMMGGPFHSGQGSSSQSEPQASDQSWNEQREKPTDQEILNK